VSEVVKDDVVTVEIEYGEEYGESPLRERRCTHRPTSERESEKSGEFFREERDEFTGEQESSHWIW